MENTPFTVKGGVYYDQEADAIYIPHYTGYFYLVDAYRYLQAEDLKGFGYDENYLKKVKEDDNYLTLNGNKYYYAEVEPVHTLELDNLTDFTDLELDWTEENTDFEY